MLFLIGWLLLAGYLLNAGYEFLGHVVLWGGLVLMVVLFISSGKGKPGNRAGKQQDDEDREMEELMFYETLFDDDEDN